MLGILGESPSDAESLRVMARLLKGDPTLRVKAKGYAGGGELLRKAAKQIRAYQRVGVRCFVVCHDADGPDPRPTRERIMSEVIRPTGLSETCCAVVPVQELEAWLLADEVAIARAIPSLHVAPIRHPESIARPKEYLERQSLARRSRPLYRHAVHNPVVARFLRPPVVSAKCPSFRVFERFILRAP